MMRKLAMWLLVTITGLVALAWLAGMPGEGIYFVAKWTVLLSAHVFLIYLVRRATSWLRAWRREAALQSATCSEDSAYLAHGPERRKPR